MYKIHCCFWVKEEISVEKLLCSWLVKCRDWGQLVRVQSVTKDSNSHNKGARCPSVKAAWVTWRMWLAYRDLSASWRGSDIRRCHRAALCGANFSYVTVTFLYYGANDDNLARPFYICAPAAEDFYFFQCFWIENWHLVREGLLTGSVW